MVTFIVGGRGTFSRANRAAAVVMNMARLSLPNGEGGEHKG